MNASVHPIGEAMTQPRSSGDDLLAVWIARTADGDRRAFEALYRTYSRRIYGYLLRLVGADAAEDVLSDVMAEVWFKAGRFRASGKASTWLFAIAHHKAVDALRRGTRAPRTEAFQLHAVPETAPGPEERAIGADGAADLRAALAELSFEQRAVLELTFVHDFSGPEIARIVGVPLGTVKTRLFHARRNLRALLEARGYSREAS